MTMFLGSGAQPAVLRWFNFHKLSAVIVLLLSLAATVELFGTQEPILVRWDGGGNFLVDQNSLDPLRYERAPKGVEAARLDLQLFDFVKVVLEGEITSRDGKVLQKPIRKYSIKISPTEPVLRIALDNSLTEPEVLAVFWTLVNKSIDADPTNRPRMIQKLVDEQARVKEQLRTERDGERKSALKRLLEEVTIRLNSLLIV